MWYHDHIISWLLKQCIFVGARPYGLGHVGNAQYTTVSGRVNIAHTPSVVQIVNYNIFNATKTYNFILKIMCLCVCI